MDVSLIRNKLIHFENLMRDKGLILPEVSLQIASDKPYHVRIYWQNIEHGEGKYKFCYAPSIEDVLAKTAQVINDLPAKHDLLLKEYAEKLAAAAEVGKLLPSVDIGPLLAEMKRLSSNIIDLKPSLRDDLNDEIPF